MTSWHQRAQPRAATWRPAAPLGTVPSSSGTASGGFGAEPGKAVGQERRVRAGSVVSVAPTRRAAPPSCSWPHAAAGDRAGGQAATWLGSSAAAAFGQRRWWSVADAIGPARHRQLSRSWPPRGYRSTAGRGRIEPGDRLAVRGSYFEGCNCDAICLCRSVGGRPADAPVPGVLRRLVVAHSRWPRRRYRPVRRAPPSSTTHGPGSGEAHTAAARRVSPMSSRLARAMQIGVICGRSCVELG